MFKVDGVPQGKGRPRFTKSGNTYTPEATKRYEAKVRFCYRGYCKNKKLDGALKMQILACFEPPKSTSKKLRMQMLSGEVRPTKKPDIDNIVKVIMDALNGVAYDDDKQIIQIEANKKYAEHSAVYIEIERIE